MTSLYALVIGAALLTTPVAYAANSSFSGRIYGAGSSTCAKAVSQSTTGPKSDFFRATYLTWLTGFLTGIVADKPLLVAVIDRQVSTKEFNDMVLSQCQAMPNSLYATEVLTVLNKLIARTTELHK